MKRFLVFLLVLSSVPNVQAATVETFASPDSSFDALSGFLSGANETLIVSSYTFSSPETAQILIGKKVEGLRVELLVEKSPAGGVQDNEKEVLCELSESGIPVHMYDGELRYMHAKYVIRDGDSALLTSENIGYSGFSPGGRYGNRGWGAIVHDEGVAKELNSLYEQDAKDSVPFSCGLSDYGMEEWDAKGAYVPLFPAAGYENQEVELIYSPDSLDEVIGLIDSAESEIIVQQFYIYTHWGSPTYDSVESVPNPLLEALIQKAREGVSVRILLDSTYYNMEEEKSVSNYNTIKRANCIAENESLPMTAAAMDLDGHGVSKLHNKGMVIDGRTALVSGINWNENSVMNNRETGIVIEGGAAGYYAEIFEKDWENALVIRCDGSRSRIEAEKDVNDYGLGFVPALLSLLALAAAVIYFSRRKNS
jgi:cardiolipin synthase